MEDLNNKDEETQRLLDELGDREQLEARAKELGVKFKGNIGDDALRQRVADAIEDQNPDGEEDQPDQDNDSDDVSETESEITPSAKEDSRDDQLTVTNNGKNLRRIEGIELAPGESHTLTEEQMDNKSLMSKVDRMIELGIFTLE